jgi:hypothetical protein
MPRPHFRDFLKRNPQSAALASASSSHRRTLLSSLSPTTPGPNALGSSVTPADSVVTKATSTLPSASFQSVTRNAERTTPSSKANDGSQQEEQAGETFEDIVAFECRTLKLRIIACEEFTSLPGWETGAPKVISETDYNYLIDLCEHQIRALMDFEGCLKHSQIIDDGILVSENLREGNASNENPPTKQAKRRLRTELAKWKKWQKAVRTHKAKVASKV